ncbi:MAG: septum site-determining protein MinC [Anaerolineales bacterium]
MDSRLQIKGIGDSLLVTIGEGEWAELRATLLGYLHQQGDFLRGGRIALDVGAHILKAAELGSLRDQVSELGITIWAVISTSPLTEKTAQSLGMATRLSRPRPERVVRPVDTALSEGDSALWVRRTLRSGVSVSAPNHIVIIGDVNPGAEINAGGDILVWGRLRGMVHAGAHGNAQAIVCALELSPTQLRIAGQIAILPGRRGNPKPEVARLENGQFSIEAWNPKNR